MPGIHPTSRRQVRFAFAAERRGELPPGTARRWAHHFKCWTKKPMPKGCADALRILARASDDRGLSSARLRKLR